MTDYDRDAIATEEAERAAFDRNWPEPIDGECTHRGAAICNALEVHSFAHDGYTDNADAYRAGWHAIGRVLNDLNAIDSTLVVGSGPSTRTLDYYTQPGPDRVAFTAGWIARQQHAKNARQSMDRARAEARMAEHLTRRAVYIAVTQALGEALGDEASASEPWIDAENNYARTVAHEEACAYTIGATADEIVRHLLALAPGQDERNPERRNCADDDAPRTPEQARAIACALVNIARIESTTERAAIAAESDDLDSPHNPHTHTPFVIE